MCGYASQGLQGLGSGVQRYSSGGISVCISKSPVNKAYEFPTPVTREVEPTAHARNRRNLVSALS